MKGKVFLTLLMMLFVAAPLYGGPIQDFSFTDLEGKTYTLADLKGTPLVVNISAHWWKKGKKEAPELQRAYLAYKDKGIVFLGVFASKEKEIRKYVKKMNLTFPVGKENGIADALGVRGVPRTIFIDRRMKIVSKLSGPLSFKALEGGIKKILIDDPMRQAALQREEESSEDCWDD